MSLVSRLLQAVRSWRPGRGRQAARRAGVAVEQLDHRQLLSVNFTGNVPVDFPASQSPGVVVLPHNPSVIDPSIPTLLKPIVKVSGFQIQDIRVSYDSVNDTLSFGINQPASQNPGQGEVIAGDADNNGNSGTVNPAIPAIQDPPGFFPFADFQDFPDFMGSEYMGTFLDFTGSGTPQVVAGYSENNPAIPTPANPNPPKPYQVAVANPSNLPVFGAALPQFTGTVYSQNSPAAPNMEFSITHFSQLYQMETGKPLTSSSVIYVGGQAGSANDIGIGEAFFPEQVVNIGAATLPTPTPPPPCPPQSPTIYVNPHEHRIIDTLHRDLVRVTIMGTSGFNVLNINPSSVTLDGAHAIAHVTRKVRRDEFPMATYVFVANQLNLPKGLQTVTLQGTLNTGQTFQSSREVLNIPYAATTATGKLAQLMGKGGVYAALSRIEANRPAGAVAIPSSGAAAVGRSANPAPGPNASLQVSYTPVVHVAGRKAESRAQRPVVSLKRADSGAIDVVSKLPTMLRHSMNDFLGAAAGHSSAGRARHAG